jgi:hypothetical protein
MQRNTVAINNIFKKIRKLNSQSAQYKKKSTNIILKKKNYIEKHRSNPKYFKRKKLQSRIFNQLNI